MTSHICDHLDIEARLQIDEISSNPERLDSQLFDIFISRHSTGLHIFAAPRRRFDVCDLNLSALAAVREIARGQVATVINRCERRLFGSIARRQHVESAIGSESVFYVAEEPMALLSANTGAPMAMTKSYRAIGKDIAAIAAFCAQVPIVAAAKT
jgi:Flp pilus assembly CpaE family ATPase